MEFISTNHHILEKIFKYCKTPTLLQCRPVCSLWAEEVGRILRKRGVTIAFRSTEDIEEFLQVARPVPQIYTNSFLVDIPTPRSPSAVVEQVPSQVVDLLDCYKGDLLELKLWYQPQFQDLSTPEDPDDSQSENEKGEDAEQEVVILKNLHTLHLLSNYVHLPNQASGQPQQQHQMPKYFTHLSTPNLRSLAIQHLHDTDCASTVIKLLETSENRIKYFKIPTKPFSSVAAGVRPLLLNNLNELDLLGIFNGFSCATNDTLESIKKSCPNLQKLGIEFSFRATPDKIQEMLSVLAETLVELKCTIQDRNLLARQIIPVNFIFPREMAKLRALQMRWSNPGLVYYIDRMPVLEELMLDTVWTRKVQGCVFPGGQSFQEGMRQYTKLTSLKLTEVVNMEQVEVFAKYFPNLQLLGCSFASNEALRMVYEKMGGLKWLTIERKSNVTEAGGVCGVNDDEDRELGIAAGDDDDDSVTVQAITRTVPYIGNLKDLETLELCQLGISSCSLLYGIVDLSKLKTLVIQSKAFRKLPGTTASATLSDKTSKGNNNNNMINQPLLNYLAPRVKQLRHLTLWIRHTSEKLSPDEINCIQQSMYYLDELTVVNHSLCGI